jgi:DNA invertase Pin-like site-specific DNA recombinase
MKKVILLVRVSSDYQNYDAQKDELIKYVQQDGYVDDDMEIITDKESATKLSDEERQGLTKMYAAIDDPKNKIEAVYCWELPFRKPSQINIELKMINLITALKLNICKH